jgi:diadenylate cyclase
MTDILRGLYYRLTSGAYDLPAVVVELFLIGLCVWWIARVLQGTRGTRPLRGVLIILVGTTLVVRVLAVQFEWVRLDLLYSYILYALAFIALVVFQPELRRAVIRVGDVRLRRNRAPQSQVVASLVKSAGYLSRNRYGALIAIQRGVDLTGWAENGTLIWGEVSANLLNTVFYPGNPLHDLGVIIRGNRVVAANCQFPSAESDEVDIALGSRHLAAVGMSYETDALVLVVSEETGVVSLADSGKLTRYLSLDDLAEELTNRLSGRVGAEGEILRKERRTSRIWDWARQALIVVPLTLIIWYVADQATSTGDTVQVLLDVRHEDPAREVAVANEPVIFETRFVGPGRAIDRLRAAARNPLLVTFTVPRAYQPRPEPYVISGSEEVRRIVEDAKEVRERGLAVVGVALTSLSFQVFERVSTTVPVRVRSTAGQVRVAVEQVDPQNVEVRVRRTDLELLQAQGAVYAELGAQLEGVQPSEVRTFSNVFLRPPPGLSGDVEIIPATVSVTVRVVAQSTKVNNVVVRLFVAPEVAELYEIKRSDLNEWRIDVEVQGDEAVFENPGSLEIEAFVHVTSDMVPPPGEPTVEQFRRLQVIFLTQKGVSVVGSRSVQVILTPRTAATPPP